MLKKIYRKLAGLMEFLSNIQLWIFTAAVGLICGFAIIITSPPFMGSDENVHFFAVQNLMRGKMIYSVPESLVEMSKPYGSFFFSPSQKYSKELWLQTSKCSPQPNEKELVTTLAYRNIVAYLPFVAVGKVCNIFSDRYLVSLYACRVVGLLIYVLLAAAAVKIIPIGKLPLTFLALMPQTMFSASMVNSDYLTFGAVMLFAALFVRECMKEDSETLTFKSPLFWSGILLGGAKFPYPLFIFLLLFLPKKMLKSSRIALAVLILSVLVLTAFQVCSLGQMPPSLDYDPHHTQVLEEMGEEPSFTEKICQFSLRLKNTLISPEWMGFLGLSFAGFLGNLCTLVYPSILAVYVSFMIASLFVARSDKMLHSRYSVWMLLAAAGGIFVVFLSFYLINCRYNHTVIKGMQGRYFIPAAVLIMAALAERVNIFKHESCRKNFIGLSLLVISAIAVAVVVTLYQRFYSSFYFDFYG